MSNFHSDKWIMERLQEHYQEALNYFPENRIVGIFLQGSQNYGLDYEGSDIDTKLIIAPSFEEVALMKKPVSTTHVRKNDEHIDFKDIRLYMGEFEKQNINFVEILFTPYAIINPFYEDLWFKLIKHREQIAHMNKYRAVKSMKGMAEEKYHALEHRYESKIAILDKFGYDPKQLSHLIRLNDFLSRYINGVLFERCLIPVNAELVLNSKKGKYTLKDARYVAEHMIENIRNMEEKYCEENSPVIDERMTELLKEVQLEIVKRSLQEELLND